MIGARHMPQFNLRMQPELIEALKAISRENGRSMNSEIVQVLKAYVKSGEAQCAGNTSSLVIEKTS